MTADFHLSEWLGNRLAHNDGKAAADHPLRRKVAAAEDASGIERVCMALSDCISLPAALMVCVAVQAMWIVAGQFTHRDPYPFNFLLTCSNVVQLVMMFAIAVGQRRAALHAERRAEQDHADISRLLYFHQTQLSLSLRIAGALNLDTEDLRGIIAALSSTP